MSRITLELPEPPSPNQLDRGVNRGHRQGKKSRCKREVWYAAVQQEAPTTSPPGKTLVTAHFRLHNKRDPDNLVGSLKLVLDALRTPRESENFGWRRGLYERKGYILDDSPDHMTLGEVTQEIDRGDRGLDLVIVDLEALEETA